MKPSRREFLAAAIGASLAAGLSCRGAARRDLEAGSGGPPAAEGLDPDEATILYYASLAPSGHNAQPWRVRVAERFHWSVESDLGRSLAATDPENREMTLSLGAFVENLAAAAGALGYEAQLTEAQGTPEHGVSVGVRIVEASPTGLPLETISLRRMVRTGQLDRPFSQALLTALAAPLEGHFYFFPRTSRQGRFIAEVALEAYRLQAGRDAAQVELARWVRFDDGQALALRDGLSAEGLEITGIAGWYIRHFVGREDLTGENFRTAGIDRAAKQVAQGAGWIVLTGAGNSAQALVEAGRRFEKVCLAARGLGVAIHPMSQALEESTWRDLLAVELGIDGLPQFVLRTGFVDRYPVPVSLRRPVSWFVERM